MVIQWRDYLKIQTKDGNYVPLPLPTDADIDDLENRLGRHLPQDFRNALKQWQGKTPTSFQVTLPKGAKPGFTCLLHAFRSDDVPEKLASYGINWATASCVEEAEQENVVVFADCGNSSYALDYSHRPDAPYVVYINGDLESEDPDSRITLADSFSEFLEKYTVPPDQAG